ncbi:MAG: heavy metal-binding domain-containing protein [Candidatus Aenigmarchaeota archaeon]|nr:heavy metal-binding domain-containing protein [Candidatus Aenigmarchaeota archaeon]
MNANNPPVYTTPTMPGKEIELMPEVTGYAATSKDFIRDFFANVRSAFGMGVPEYKEMVRKAVEGAKEDMVSRASALYGDIDGIVGYSAGTEPMGPAGDIMVAKATGTPFRYKGRTASKAQATA